MSGGRCGSLPCLLGSTRARIRVHTNQIRMAISRPLHHNFCSQAEAHTDCADFGSATQIVSDDPDHSHAPFGGFMNWPCNHEDLPAASWAATLIAANRVA